VIARLQRWGAAHWWRASGRARRDRRELYGGAHGLRIVCFHDMPPANLEALDGIVDLARRRMAIGSPADADGLFEGRWRADGVDRLLFTFDDGLATQYEAARRLAQARVSAIFFVVPSLVGRTMAEFVRFHAENGVRAYAPVRDSEARGLSAAQVREMVAMGHRVAAHNFAHRDLGRIHDPGAIHYEVTRAVEGVAALTGGECRDFAIGFGQPDNVSDEAAAFLAASGLRVYACHRGLNVPGRTPRFLLRHSFEPDHPMAFTRVCLEGGADRRLADRASRMARRVGVLPA